MTYEIWTVGSADNLPDEPPDTEIIGSWTSRREAVRACADYIVDRCSLRRDLTYAILHDENHPDAPKEIASRAGIGENELLKKCRCRLTEEWEMPENVAKAMGEYLEEEILAASAYEITTDFESDVGTTEWLFGVVKNTLTLEDDLIIKSVSYK